MFRLWAKEFKDNRNAAGHGGSVTIRMRHAHIKFSMRWRKSAMS